MPALINNRLAAAFEAIPPDDRTVEKLALAAYRVMEGAALALGLPSTGVAFRVRTGTISRFGYVVSWPDGPDNWAYSAARDLPHVKIYAGGRNDSLYFEERAA